MRHRQTFSLLIVTVCALLATASCWGAASPAPAAADGEAGAYMSEASAAPAAEAPAAELAAAAEPAAAAPVAGADIASITSSDAVIFNLGAPADAGQAAQSERMIIKNAEVQLQVADADTATDRITQIVGDLSGYIVSSRSWFETAQETNYKYATITFAVPAAQFEQALRRLREIAVRVLDERASGQDVTEEFVDLTSRLDNLKATRDRIRGFLDQARTVEEALKVNEDLSAVEAEIAQTQGRINYLSGRASYSTITVTISPELPTPAPTPTLTPTPTTTPEAWRPADTFGEASRTLSSAYQAIGDILIWIGVVLVPILAPILALALAARYFLFSRRRK